jgi:hypothetical protein
VIEGCYIFSINRPELFRQGFVGIVSNGNFEKTPEQILSLKEFSTTLYFYKKFEDVESRKVQLILKDFETEYTINLCGNDLMLIEMMEIEVEDFSLEDLVILEKAELFGSNNKIFHLAD